MGKQNIKPFIYPDDRFVKMHNALFDLVLPALPPNAWKILCLIIRETFGRSDKGTQRNHTQDIGYRAIITRTGISSNATIKSSLDILIKSGCILATESDGFHAASFRLNPNFTISSKEQFQAIVGAIEKNPSVTETVALPKRLSATETVALSATETVAASLKDNLKTNKEKGTTYPVEPSLDDSKSALDDYDSYRKKLFAFMDEKTGKIPDGAAQGKAIKWLYENSCCLEDCMECFECLLDEARDPGHWRSGRVSWMLVRNQIGTWLVAKNNPKEGIRRNGKESASERNVRLWKENLEDIGLISAGDNIPIDIALESCDGLPPAESRREKAN